MHYVFFPDTEEHSQTTAYTKETGPVGKELSVLAKKRQDLFLDVYTFLKKMTEVTDLTPYYKSEQIRALGSDLHEMRIPKTRSGGVFRIYFCHSLSKEAYLILLEAELKHKKAGKKIPQARANLKKYKELFQKGAMI
jgi:phage-related protein